MNLHMAEEERPRAHSSTYKLCELTRISFFLYCFAILKAVVEGEGFGEEWREKPRLLVGKGWRICGKMVIFFYSQVRGGVMTLLIVFYQH